MKQEGSSKKDLYYTNDHEWIDFQGAVAYTGVCIFKLTGFKEITNIIFNVSSGFLKQGEIIAVIQSKDYTVEAHMPVNGKVLQLNEALVNGEKNLLVQDPENEGWIALVVPALPYDRTGLLISKHYQRNDKDKYAKG